MALKIIRRHTSYTIAVIHTPTPSYTIAVSRHRCHTPSLNVLRHHCHTPSPPYSITVIHHCWMFYAITVIHHRHLTKSPSYTIAVLRHHRHTPSLLSYTPSPSHTIALHWIVSNEFVLQIKWSRLAACFERYIIGLPERRCLSEFCKYCGLGMVSEKRHPK